MCVGCGKPNDNGHVKCDACLAVQREYEQKRYYELAEQHRCVHCSKQMPKDWFYIICDRCRGTVNVRQREYNKRKREERRGTANGTVYASMG